MHLHALSLLALLACATAHAQDWTDRQIVDYQVVRCAAALDVNNVRARVDLYADNELALGIGAWSGDQASRVAFEACLSEVLHGALTGRARYTRSVTLPARDRALVEYVRLSLQENLPSCIHARGWANPRRSLAVAVETTAGQAPRFQTQVENAELGAVVNRCMEEIASVIATPTLDASFTVEIATPRPPLPPHAGRLGHLCLWPAIAARQRGIELPRPRRCEPGLACCWLESGGYAYCRRRCR